MGCGRARLTDWDGRREAKSMVSIFVVSPAQKHKCSLNEQAQPSLTPL
jgi:hypothetical protein